MAEINLIIAIDFSEESKNALKFVSKLFRKSSVHFNLLHTHNVIDYVPEVFGYSIDNDTNEQALAESNLNKICIEIINTDSNYTCEAIIKKGELKDSLAELETKKKIDLIVLGVKKSSGIKNQLFSTIESIINQTHIPVLSIPSETKYSPLSKIGFATDFKASDFKAISKAIALFGETQPEIIITHIEKNFSKSNNSFKLFRKELESLVSYPNISYRLLTNEDIIKQVQKFTIEEKIDLLIITSNHKTFFERIFSPGISRKLIWNTISPTLLFHSTSVNTNTKIQQYDFEELL